MAIYAPSHPSIRAKSNPYVLEYRLVAEQMLGRFLERWEVVHHKNGDHTDNRPENLSVMSQADHAAIHSTGRKRKK